MRAARLPPRRSRRGKLLISLEIPEVLPPLPAAVEVAAYRIGTEAIHNVVRHAGAAHCWLRLRLADALILEVLDDGRGLPPNFNPETGLGLGLEIVQTTVVEDMQGAFHIGPVEDQPGTLVQISVPMKIMTRA